MATVPDRTRGERWVLLAAVLASSMAFIDATALHVALPALQTELGASGSALLWVVNSYALFLTALLLLGGALGDRYGRRRVFMIGISLFAVASLACGVAPNTEMLIAARAVQGMGGAVMIPGSLAIISASFAVERRGKAIGTWSAFSVITTALGPILGGLLARAGLWRGVFFINLPLAAFALTALALRVPESRDPQAPARLDYAGAAAATVGLLALNYGLIEATAGSVPALAVWLALGVGVAALGFFCFHEARTAHPLLPLELFRSRTFSGANLLTLCLYTAFHGIVFFLPLNLIQVQGYSPALAGLTQLPVMILLIALSRWVGGVVDRHGARLPLTVGPLIAGVGLLALAIPGVTRGPADFWAHYLPALTLLGLGMAITITPLSTTVMGSVPGGRSGLASGINSTVSRLAGVLAIAGLGTVALAVFPQRLATHTANEGLSPAAHLALRSEAAKLGNARVPDGLDDQTQAAVQHGIRLAFVDTFRLIALIAAGLSWLGALVAAWTMKRLQ